MGKKICAITGSRAEYGVISGLLKKLSNLKNKYEKVLR